MAEISHDTDNTKEVRENLRKMGVPEEGYEGTTFHHAVTPWVAMTIPPEVIKDKSPDPVAPQVDEIEEAEKAEKARKDAENQASHERLLASLEDARITRGVRMGGPDRAEYKQAGYDYDTYEEPDLPLPFASNDETYCDGRMAHYGWRLKQRELDIFVWLELERQQAAAAAVQQPAQPVLQQDEDEGDWAEDEQGYDPVWFGQRNQQGEETPQQRVGRLKELLRRTQEEIKLRQEEARFRLKPSAQPEETASPSVEFQESYERFQKEACHCLKLATAGKG